MPHEQLHTDRTPDTLAANLVEEPTRASSNAEAERIRVAYAKRPDHDSRYSWFNPAHVYDMQERERRVLALLRRERVLDLSGIAVLDLGCGSGHWLRDLLKWGASPEHMVGVDLLADRVTRARQLCPAGITIECANATRLPYADASFDLVIQSTVFTSMLDGAVRRQAAAEVLRVLRPGGRMLWYDFHMNNPRNADVRAVKKAEIRALFPGCDIRLERITLAPPLARWVSPRSRVAFEVLSTVPFLCTHYLGIIRRS
jgi:ubiquinone/menaquinone biosynthesis C-methylase UbiE